MRRYLFGLILILAIPLFGDDNAKKFEELVLYDIEQLAAADHPTAQQRAALQNALDLAVSLDNALLAQIAKEPADDLNVRHRNLLAGIKKAKKALGDDVESDDARQDARLIAELNRLVEDVLRETTACQLQKDACDLDQLARDRFALRDAMERLIARDKEVLDKLAKAKTEEEAQALGDRHADIIGALADARAISFPGAESRTEEDELVDQAKRVDARLTALERIERRDAQQDAERAALTTQLAQIERKLKAQGIADRKSIAGIDEQLKSGNVKLKFDELIADRKKYAARLAAIESIVTLPAGDNPIYRVYDDDYEDWYINQFYLGGEFDSVSGLLNTGFARIGYTAWWHFGGEDIPESHPPDGLLKTGYGWHWQFSALLTSSAEQNIGALLKQEGSSDTDPCNDPEKKCVRRALEAEQKVFWPLYRSARHNRLRWYFGPVLSLGAKFVDPEGKDDTAPERIRADYRYYGGLHSGFGRDAYFEVFYGRTHSLKTRRIEFRGEVPVARWGQKSRLLLGGTANIRAGHPSEPFTAEHPNIERDVYRVYVQYEIDFLSLTGLKAPK